MILTEQNRNPEEMGATRTFSVANHSADTMKQHINAANEQSLNNRNMAADAHGQPQAQRARQGQNMNPGRPDGAVRMDQAQSRPAPRPANPNQQAQSRQPQPQAVNMNGNIREQNGAVRSNPRMQPQNPVRTGAAQNMQPRLQNMQNDRQNLQTDRQNTQTDRQNVRQNNVQNVSRTAQPRQGMSDPVQSSAARPAARPMRGNAEQQTPRAVVPAKPAPKPAQKAVSVQSAVTRNEVKETRPMMMKTKTTDVSSLKNEQVKKEAKKAKKTESPYLDEGGNTVVSAVKAIVYIIFVIVISVFLALCIINVGNDMFAFVKSDEIVEVTIPEYATLDEVTDILYKNDIIKYPTIFKLYAVAENIDRDFLAGTYPVNGMMNYETLLNEFKEKPESGTVDITIPEGYTIDEMIDLFVEGYGIGTREGFVDVIQNSDFDYWFIDELEANGIDDGRIYRLEGYLFPDTYQFYKASSEYTVVDKMLKRFTQIFTKEYRTQCETLGYTVDEMVTLASLIEKEAGSPSDFFIVSSVFHNRLNSPWNFPKLESDATVVYVLSHEKGERTTVTAEDLKLDTPYNTYLYEGFPPGPIANPSASAMLAALSPTKTNFYYFITNKGILYPSETKAQHDAYIAEFSAQTPAQQTTGDVPDETQG